MHAHHSSAYHHYSRINSSIVKEELLKEGKDTALGMIVSVVSAKWKTIPEDEKAQYEEMAREDRARYAQECAIRDEEVLRLQEEKRKQHSYEATESRMRGK
jgi:precorrin-2 methylase